MDWNPYWTGSKPKLAKGKVVRSRKNQNYRHSRDRTSSGQAQALWTFLVAIAVAVAALAQISQQSTALAVDDASRGPASISVERK